MWCGFVFSIDVLRILRAMKQKDRNYTKLAKGPISTLNGPLVASGPSINGIAHIYTYIYIYIYIYMSRYCTAVLYCTVLYCTVLYCTVWEHLFLVGGGVSFFGEGILLTGEKML